MRVALPAAIVTGVLIAVQTVIIGAFGVRLNAFVASTWIHVGGLAFGVAGILIARLGFHVDVVRDRPWGLLAGVCGVLLVTGIGIAVAGIGIASTLAIVTGTQLLVGFALEASGVVGGRVAFDPVRIGGALLIVVGVYLVASRGPTVV